MNDVEGALADGHSEADIANFLGKKKGFNVDKAVEDGQSYENIIHFLTTGKELDASPNPISSFTRGLYGGLADFAGMPKRS